VVDERQIRYFEMQHERNPQGRFFVPLADLYIKAGRLAEAEDLLISGLARHPASIPARLLLGLCYQAQGRMERAVEIFEQVLDSDPENTRVPDRASLDLEAEEAAAARAADEAAQIAREIDEIREPAPPTEPEEETDSDPCDETAGTPPLEPEPDPVPVETPPAQETPEPAPAPVEDPPAAPAPPLAPDVPALFLTGTLADVYLAQGRPDRALKILYHVLSRHPEREDLAARIAAIEAAVDEDGPTGARTVDEPRQSEAGDPDRFEAWLARELEGGKE